MRASRLRQFALEHLAMVQRDEPRAAAHEVVVKFHAASLNYRDLMFAKGTYNPNARLPAVPLSDAAGEIVAVRRKRDPLANRRPRLPDFHAKWLEGERSPQKDRSSSGPDDWMACCGNGASNEKRWSKFPSIFPMRKPRHCHVPRVTAWNALVHMGGSCRQVKRF